MQNQVTFEDLAGDESVFFSNYFNKLPLLRKGALSPKLDSLLTSADLDSLLYSEAIRPPYIRLSKGGDPVHEITYTRLMRVQGEYMSDSVDPERVLGHFRTGATITWNSLNHFEPKMRQLASVIADKLGGRSDIIAFLTPAGRQGFLPHHDPVDLFIIQLEGTKYWKLWAPPELRPGGYAHFDEQDLGEPLFEVSLNPGDVLYLPYNTPHVAAAENTTSLHLSAMLRPRRWNDLLQEVVESVVKDDPRFWGFPYLGAVDEASTEFEANLKLMVQLLSDLDPRATVELAHQWGRDLEGVRIETPFSKLKSYEQLTAGSEISVRGDEAVYVELEHAPNRKSKVIVDGSVYSVSEAIATALSDLKTSGRTQAGTFISTSEQDSMKVVRSLIKIGAVEVG